MYFSTCDQLFFDGQLSCNFNMTAAENPENQPTLIKDYRKTERYTKKLQVYYELLTLYSICDIVIEFFFAYRQAFLAVVLGYHRASKKQPQGVFEKKNS